MWCLCCLAVKIQTARTKYYTLLSYYTTKILSTAEVSVIIISRMMKNNFEKCSPLYMMMMSRSVVVLFRLIPFFLLLGVCVCVWVMCDVLLCGVVWCVVCVCVRARGVVVCVLSHTSYVTVEVQWIDLSLYITKKEEMTVGSIPNQSRHLLSGHHLFETSQRVARGLASEVNAKVT